MSTPAVLIRISTGEILKRRDLSEITTDFTQPLPGLDPDTRWHVEVVPYVAPDYDERYYTLDVTHELVATAPEGFHASFGQYITRYGTTKRPTSEVCVNIDNAERVALQELFGTADATKKVLQFIGSLDRKAASQVLTARESESLEELAALHAKVTQNAALAAQKKAAVEAGEEPDIDAGFLRS